MKLNLGCGYVHLESFINVDIRPAPAVDVICDVGHLPYKEESIDLIYTSHCIEHINYARTPAVLKEWARVMKPEGVLRIYTPDFDKLVTDYIISHTDLTVPPDPSFWTRVRLYLKWWYSVRHRRLLNGLTGVIVGHDDTSPHRALFTYKFLKGLLEDAGFYKVRKLKIKDRWKFEDASRTSFSLAIECKRRPWRALA